MQADEALANLDSRRAGLDQQEARQRKARFGPNSLPSPPPPNPLFRLLAQFNSALIYFLLASAAAALMLGHMVDAVVVLFVVLINALVGFVQEGKAERALGAIRDLIAPHATVLRDGARQTVAASDLVPGDVVLLEAGDRVPADVRIVRAHGLTIDEALLTGESVAADKQEAAVAVESALGERRSMAFSGTLVAGGQATGVVTATGSRTQIGHISGLVQSVEEVTTPLLRQINSFARRFTALVLAGAALLFIFAVVIRNYDWSDALIAVVALAVGAIPEGLPAVITITLAIGVQRMAARKAVIRKLPAVETLGATSVICTDKTGTLTRNEMTARRIVVAGHEIRVSGSGYGPEGALTAENHDDDIAAVATASPIIRAALLCNDARLRQAKAGWIVEGDPMEGALVALAMKAGFNPDHVRDEWVRLDEIPFDAMHRFMATLHRAPDVGGVIMIKGAPEAVLDMIPAGDRAGWAASAATAAAAGERVLGFGMKRLAAPQDDLSFDDLGEGVEFLGLIGFIDPPREEALAAVAQCRSAGIAVKMVTGDHVATALAIARQLDLADDPKAMTGAELDAVSDDDLAIAIADISVFARTSPEHKLRIIQALQKGGAIVAMTGDGVNDAPALKQADVGTAMGLKGTEAAREAAHMVLLDDNFASIVAAVREGRTVHDNIRKVIALTLPTDGGEMLVIVLAIVLGFALPMTATQILWINLVTAVTLGLVLAFEPAEPGVMCRPPRAADAPLLSPFLLWRIVLLSLLFTAMSLGIFFHALDSGRGIETGRTMVVNMVAAAEVFYMFSVRYLHMRSLTWRGALGTPAVLWAVGGVVASQLLFTYAPFMNDIFETRPLTMADGLLIIGIAVGLLLLLELEKLLMRRLGWFAEVRP
ncbi:MULTISPECIES: HAD-IC family P-type ATPase [unclassified Sphingomonas]|uniref:HAD-IC family P-type ATPase n=1 Tax=unclassified Sphingomonas TaxID=196159 RepID=UPI0006F623AF|nr:MULTISPECIES: HAD-IC family P-type ATPase [unclassified Sphingomonas]KQX26362.1 carbonate dehydratase [Sphingomonas sp. Root1294]KQY69432.1 carbonate dehydratase [Sphingomonas sp. Root50]KRB89842.1 carbonate dehydratase [Sphingomonas sp. Root720]